MSSLMWARPNNPSDLSPFITEPQNDDEAAAFVEAVATIFSMLYEFGRTASDAWEALLAAPRSVTSLLAFQRMSEFHFGRSLSVAGAASATLISLDETAPADWNSRPALRARVRVGCLSLLEAHAHYPGSCLEACLSLSAPGVLTLHAKFGAAFPDPSPSGAAGDERVGSLLALAILSRVFMCAEFHAHLEELRDGTAVDTAAESMERIRRVGTAEDAAAVLRLIRQLRRAGPIPALVYDRASSRLVFAEEQAGERHAASSGGAEPQQRQQEEGG